MNKLSLLTLVLIVALPGCGNGKKQSSESVKKSNVAKYADVTGDVEPEYYALEGMDEDEEGMGMGDTEEEESTAEEGDEYEAGIEEMDYTDLDDLDYEDLEGLAGLDEDEDNEELGFRWVDSQEEDEFKSIHFTFNHYGIREDQKAVVNYDIEQVKQLLAEAGTTADATVVIEGHACQEGTPAYNVGLSEKRAKFVADCFVAAGIDRNRIKVVGRGQECPVIVNGKAINGSREDRAPNRRVEVRVIYT